MSLPSLELSLSPSMPRQTPLEQPADLLGLYGRDPWDYSEVPVYILTGHSGQDITGGREGVCVCVSHVAAVAIYLHAWRVICHANGRCRCM